MNLTRLCFAALGTVALAAQSLAFATGQVNWFIGVDNRTTIPSGPFVNLPNPNYNRLTFLYGHQYDGIGDGGLTEASNHYHAKSPWVYLSGSDPSNPVIRDRPSGNLLPEDGSRIDLSPTTTGPLAGWYTTKSPTDVKWANSQIRPTAWLNRPGATSGEQILFNSGGTTPAGRWARSLGQATVALQIVSISSGVRVYNDSQTGFIDQVGQYLTLGNGDNWAFTPTVALNPASGQKQATISYRLIDLNRTTAWTPLGDSGVFEMRYDVVPEPATLLAFGLGLSALAARRRRR